jgi:hypothetical protein
MLGRLSEAVARGATSVRGTTSARGARYGIADRAASLRDVPALGIDAAARARRAITWQRLAGVAALALAFAVPFAGRSSGGESVPAAAVTEPPARVAAPLLPRLSAVAALPEPPRVVRRTPPAPVSAPTPVATPEPVPTPVAAAPAPAPAPVPTPAPERKTVDLEG